jgi:hypothetical protein
MLGWTGPVFTVASLGSIFPKVSEFERPRGA